jgi:hypothetical protein
MTDIIDRLALELGPGPDDPMKPERVLLRLAMEQIATLRRRLAEVERERDTYRNAHKMEQEMREEYGDARDAALARVASLEAALRRLADAVAKMKVPQTREDAALLVLVTLGPALDAARSVLAAPDAAKESK